MKRLLSLFLVCALLLPFCAFAEEDTLSEIDRKVDAHFGRKSHHLHCGEIVIAKDGKIVYQRSYGFIPGTNKTIAANPNSYYRIASVSKLITATAYMRLVETAQIDLDENIGEYLHLEGEEPFFASSARYKKVGITSRMLMTHTSCIWCDKFSPTPGVTDALNQQKKKSSIYYFYKEKPGTAYHYSNYAAGILGCIIEAIENKRLDEAVADLLFDRMGIDAGYSPEYLDIPENITSDVIREYGECIDLDNDYVFGYGNCWMKCSDLCKIGMMLCDGGLFEGQRILETETVQEMLSSQKGKGGITVDSPYGLNVQRLIVPTFDENLMFYGHQGTSDNSLCALYFNPDTRFVFAMTSVCTKPLESMGKQYSLRNLVYDLLGDTWNEFGK